jgi:hypothetical protein
MANMRSIFDFSAESAKIEDWLAEGVEFELSCMDPAPCPSRSGRCRSMAARSFTPPSRRNASAAGLRLFVLPPRSPKHNGAVERAQRTHTEEFYEIRPFSDFSVAAVNREAQCLGARLQYRAHASGARLPHSA